MASIRNFSISYLFLILQKYNFVIHFFENNPQKHQSFFLQKYYYHKKSIFHSQKHLHFQKIKKQITKKTKKGEKN